MLNEVYFYLMEWGVVAVVCVIGLIEYIYFRFGVDETREVLRSIDDSLKCLPAVRDARARAAHARKVA